VREEKNKKVAIKTTRKEREEKAAEVAIDNIN
jgi:hypothetical protein